MWTGSISGLFLCKSSEFSDPLLSLALILYVDKLGLPSNMAAPTFEGPERRERTKQTSYLLLWVLLQREQYHICWVVLVKAVTGDCVSPCQGKTSSAFGWRGIKVWKRNVWPDTLPWLATFGQCNQPHNGPWRNASRRWGAHRGDFVPIFVMLGPNKWRHTSCLLNWVNKYKKSKSSCFEGLFFQFFFYCFLFNFCSQNVVFRCFASRFVSSVRGSRVPLHCGHLLHTLRGFLGESSWKPWTHVMELSVETSTLRTTSPSCLAQPCSKPGDFFFPLELSTDCTRRWQGTWDPSLEACLGTSEGRWYIWPYVSPVAAPKTVVVALSDGCHSYFSARQEWVCVFVGRGREKACSFLNRAQVGEDQRGEGGCRPWWHWVCTGGWQLPAGEKEVRWSGSPVLPQNGLLPWGSKQKAKGRQTGSPAPCLQRGKSQQVWPSKVVPISIGDPS